MSSAIVLLALAALFINQVYSFYETLRKAKAIIDDTLIFFNKLKFKFVSDVKLDLESKSNQSIKSYKILFTLDSIVYLVSLFLLIYNIVNNNINNKSIELGSISTLFCLTTSLTLSFISMTWRRVRFQLEFSDASSSNLEVVKQKVLLFLAQVTSDNINNSFNQFLLLKSIACNDNNEILSIIEQSIKKNTERMEKIIFE